MIITGLGNLKYQINTIMHLPMIPYDKIQIAVTEEVVIAAFDYPALGEYGILQNMVRGNTKIVPVWSETDKLYIGPIIKGVYELGESCMVCYMKERTRTDSRDYTTQRYIFENKAFEAEVGYLEQDLEILCGELLFAGERREIYCFDTSSMEISFTKPPGVSFCPYCDRNEYGIDTMRKELEDVTI